MKFQVWAYREIISTVFCVTGLSLIMLAYFVFSNTCNVSIILGTVVGSITSILNRIIQVFVVQIEKKNSQNSATFISLLNIFRMLFMSTVAFFILTIPQLHSGTGTITLFFSQISRVIIKLIKRNDN